MKWREYSSALYFQSQFWRVVKILSQVAADEAVILKGTRDEAPLEEYLPYLAAEDRLPMWVDFFYISFRMLAERFCVTLGTLANAQTGTWPKFKELMKADLQMFHHWKVSDAESLHEALRANRDWFDLLTTVDNKGARDAIIHTLGEPKVVTATQDDGTRSVIIWRETPTGYEDRDLIALIPEIVGGFCSMLFVPTDESVGQRAFRGP